MADVPLLIPEINYALPEADGERVNVSIPHAWLPFVVKALTEITDADLHTGGEALHIANRYKIDAVITDLEIVPNGGGMFIGAVVTHALAMVPSNLLVCDGTVYNRVDYPDLYAAIHANLIIDADTFRVPDLQDKFVKGEWASQAIATTGGEKTHTLTTSEMPGHVHQQTSGSLNDYTVAPAFIGSSGTARRNTTNTYLTTDSTIPLNTQTSGGGQSHNNEPQFYILRYAIVASL